MLLNRSRTFSSVRFDAVLDPPVFVLKPSHVRDVTQHDFFYPLAKTYQMKTSIY